MVMRLVEKKSGTEVIRFVAEKPLADDPLETFLPLRCRKTIKQEWRTRHRLATRPERRGKYRKRETVTYTLEGECRPLVRDRLEKIIKVVPSGLSPPENLKYKYTTEEDIQNKLYLFYYDQAERYQKDSEDVELVIVTSLTIEDQAGKPEESRYKYTMTLEEVKEVK